MSDGRPQREGSSPRRFHPLSDWSIRIHDQLDGFGLDSLGLDSFWARQFGETMQLCQHVTANGAQNWQLVADRIGCPPALCALKWHVLVLDDGRAKGTIKAPKWYSDWELSVLVVARNTGQAQGMSKMSIFTAMAGWLPGRTATGLKQAFTSNLTTSDGSLPAHVANTLQTHGWPNDLAALMQQWPGPHDSFRARSLGEDRALAQELVRTLREQTPQSAASSGRRSSSAASSGAGSQQAAAAAAAAATATPPASPQAIPAAHHPLQLNPAQPSLAPQATAADAPAPELAAPTLLAQEVAAPSDSDLLQQLLDGVADGGGMFSQGLANIQQWPMQQQQQDLLLPGAGGQAAHPVTNPQRAATYGPMLATAASMTAPQQIPAVFPASGQLPVPAAAEPQTVAVMQGPDTAAMSAAVQHMYNPASLQAAAAAALEAASSTGPAAAAETAAGPVVSSAATTTGGRLAGSLSEFELPEEDSVLRALLEQHLDAALGGLHTSAAGTNPSMPQQQLELQQELQLEQQQQQQQHPAGDPGLAGPSLPLGEGRAVIHGKRRRMEEVNTSLLNAAAAAAAAQGRAGLPSDQAAQQALGRASSFPGARGLATAQHSTAQDASMLACANLSEPEQLLAPPIVLPSQQVMTMPQRQPTLQQMQQDVWHIFEASQPQQTLGGAGQQLWQQYQTQLAGQQQQQQPHPAPVAAFVQPQLLSPQHSLETQAAWQQISGLVQRVALLEHNQQQMQQELAQLRQEMYRGSRSSG